jgi:hypothetical protein
MDNSQMLFGHAKDLAEDLVKALYFIRRHDAHVIQAVVHHVHGLNFRSTGQPQQDRCPLKVPHTRHGPPVGTRPTSGMSGRRASKRSRPIDTATRARQGASPRRVGAQLVGRVTTDTASATDLPGITSNRALARFQTAIRVPVLSNATSTTASPFESFTEPVKIAELQRPWVSRPRRRSSAAGGSRIPRR